MDNNNYDDNCKEYLSTILCISDPKQFVGDTQEGYDIQDENLWSILCTVIYTILLVPVTYIFDETPLIAIIINRF